MYVISSHAIQQHQGRKQLSIYKHDY